MSDLCVHQLIEAQAARTPDALAIFSAEGVVSFRRLDDRASALAAGFAAGGVYAGLYDSWRRATAGGAAA